MVTIRASRIHLDRGFPKSMVPLQGILSYSLYTEILFPHLAAALSQRVWVRDTRKKVLAHDATDGHRFA